MSPGNHNQSVAHARCVCRSMHKYWQLDSGEEAESVCALRCKSDRPLSEYECEEKLMSTRINALHLTWLGQGQGDGSGVSKGGDKKGRRGKKGKRSNKGK